MHLLIIALIVIGVIVLGYLVKLFPFMTYINCISATTMLAGATDRDAAA